MHDVGTEVDTEADADDEDVHAGDLDGDAPPVHEAGHVQAGEEDAEHDEEGAAPAAQCDEGRDEDAEDGDADIPQQFDAHNGVRLPVDVGEGDGEAGVAPGDLGDNPLHLSHRRDPVRGGAEPGDITSHHIRPTSELLFRVCTLCGCRGWLAAGHLGRALHRLTSRRTRNVAGI